MSRSLQAKEAAEVKVQTYERAGLVEEAASCFFWLQAWGREARKIRSRPKILGAILRTFGFYLKRMSS